MLRNPFKLTDLISCGVEFLDGVFESITNGITITNDKSIILYVNKAFTQITGYSKSDAIGNNPGMLHSGRHNKEYYQSMWETIQKNGAWSGEIWNRHKNGHLLPEWLTITKLEANDKIYYVAVFSDITTLIIKTKEKLNLAYTDPLTGLYNKAFIETVFAIHKNKTNYRKIDSNNLALLFIDINKFKLLNDTYGHLAGDRGLKYVSSIIKANIRNGDTAIRFGGDEFIIILNNIKSKNKVIEICARIKEAIKNPFVYEDHEIHIGLSIGAALYPRDSTKLDELIKFADKAMYKSKSNDQYLNFYVTNEL